MNYEQIAQDALEVVQVAKVALDVGADAAPFVKKAYTILSGGGALSDADRAELLAQELALRAQLNQDPAPMDD